ncbi:MAG: glutamate--tRNA ligase family protein, partial [Phycisphaerae bacterium]
LGWQPPAHAHMPLVFNMDNTKMSKRDKTKAARAAVALWIKQGNSADTLAEKSGIAADQLKEFLDKKTDDSRIAAAIGAALGVPLPEIDVQDFRRSGYVSDALLNFIALIGWSPGENREILTRDEMLQSFSLETIGKTSGRFDRKKLLWMNGEYIRMRTIDDLLHDLAAFNAVTDYPIKHASESQRRELLAMYQERTGTLAEMAENSRFFFAEPKMDAAAFKKHIESGNGRAVLRQIRDMLAAVSDWSKEQLAPLIEKIIELGQKRGSAPQTLRVALCGGPVSPPLLETLCLLGRDTTLARIDHILLE